MRFIGQFSHLPVHGTDNVAFNVPLLYAQTTSINMESLTPFRIAQTRLAQDRWRETPLRDRLLMLRRFRELLAARAGEAAQIAAQSSGRPISEILTAQVLPLLDACRFLERHAASILRARKSGMLGRPALFFGVRAEVLREPLGLVLLIAPSNYPFFIPGVSALQALAAGNAVILKPGLAGTGCALFLASLFDRAGLDDRLLRVIPEAPTAAQDAINYGVDKVVFTGSAETGGQILQQLAQHLTPATMELSGCDAVIIRADADLELAARALLFALRLNAGRTCVAPRRIFVTSSVATELEGRLARASTSLEQIRFSPGQSLAGWIRDALAQGAHLITGSISTHGEIRAPLILGGVPARSPLLRQDLFEPVATLVTVADDEEAISQANACPFALGAAVFTSDENAGRRLATRLRGGVVVINDLIVPTADPRLPFGGRKRSGFGVTRGAEGLLAMTAPKVVARRGGKWRPHYDPPHEGDAELFSTLAEAIHGSGWSRRIRSWWKIAALASRRKSPH